MLACLLAACLASAGHAEQTRTATSAAIELPHGDAAGVAVTSRGRLFAAPVLSPWSKAPDGADPAQVLAIAVDRSGAVLLATGPDGQVLRVAGGGETKVFFRADEPLVTALLVLPSGDLLAASAPGGKIYKVSPDGKGAVWADTDERYVWAMLPGPADSVYAATGDRGRLLKLDAKGRSTILFDADEPHLVSLAAAAGDGVYAGGSGHGLVYRIDGQGHAAVLYADDDLPEAKAVVVEPGGGVLVALDAAPAPEKRLPAVRIRMAGGGGTGASRGERGDLEDLDARDGGSLSGVIEGLPSRDDSDEGVRLRGRVVRIAPSGGVTELWKSATEAPFALALDGGGKPIFGTGEPARLWRVEDATETALLATLGEAQATAIAPAGGALVLATSNPAAAYRLDRAPAAAGTYVALPVDAGGIARWGTASWRVEGTGGSVDLSTRTGNSEDPDGTWSPWSTPSTDAAGSAIHSPDGRYLQWRLRFPAGATTPRVSSVSVTYAPRNRAPTLRDFRVDPPSGAVGAKATFRWSAADPDGDPVSVDIQIRKRGTDAWTAAAHYDPPPPMAGEAPSGGDSGSREGKVIWDASGVDEGVYDVRAVASDQPSNPPGEGLTWAADLPIPARVDHTPPVITSKRVDGAVEVLVTDSGSAVVRLEVLEGTRVVASPRCADGVCDGTRESFRIAKEDAGAPGTRTLRATDAAGNTAEEPVPSP